MKTVIMKKYKKPISCKVAENKMKEIKSLLIKLPTTIALVSMMALIIISKAMNTNHLGNIQELNNKLANSKQVFIFW
jgi:hypothetical protein